MSTMTWRCCLPPYGAGVASPGIVNSRIADEVQPVVEDLLLAQGLRDDRVSCATGTLDALYWTITGGVIPGGRMRVTVFDTLVI